MVNPPFIMGWDLVDIGWFCESCYRVVASEGDFNVSVFWSIARRQATNYVLYIICRSTITNTAKVRTPVASS